jgi:putative transposase
MLQREIPRAGVEIWAYCLMPNHVHLVAVPSSADGLAKLFGVAHKRYASEANGRNDWQGHLWQARFHSVVLDERHLFAAVRYIELNPVRAGLCRRPEDWPWSSVHAHLTDRPDRILERAPVLRCIADWSNYLASASDGPAFEELRRQTRSGRPFGDPQFIEKLESLTGRQIRKQKAGRKPKK